MNNADKVRAKIKELMKFSAVVKNFTDVPLKDGTTLVTDDKELKVGSILYTVDADGKQTVCQDGTYETQEGKTIVISGGVGAIETVSDASVPTDNKDNSPVADANVTPAVPAVPVAAAADPAATVAPATPAVPQSDDDSAIEDRLNQLENQVAQILELLQGMQNVQQETMTAVTRLSANDPEAVPAMVQLSRSKATSAKEEYNSLMNKTSDNISNRGENHKDSQIADLFNTMKKYNFGKK